MEAQMGMKSEKFLITYPIILLTLAVPAGVIFDPISKTSKNAKDILFSPSFEQQLASSTTRHT